MRTGNRLRQSTYSTFYGAICPSDPVASISSATDQSRSVIPASIAGVMRKVRWILTKL